MCKREHLERHFGKTIHGYYFPLLTSIMDTFPSQSTINPPYHKHPPNCNHPSLAEILTPHEHNIHLMQYL